METVNKNESINSRLAFCTLAAGAFSLGAQADPTVSPAAVTVTDTGDGDGSVEVPVDIDGDGTDDFDIVVDFNTGCSFNDGSVRLEGVYDSGLGAYLAEFSQTPGDSYAGNISAGTSLPGTEYGGFSYLAVCNNESGEFPPDTRGFVGVQFMSGGNTHNAYLDLEVAQGSLSATLHSACFESTPGAPLVVGACNSRAVPVGGLIPMTLGVLAVGAAALRRRRKLLN